MNSRGGAAAAVAAAAAAILSRSSGIDPSSSVCLRVCRGAARAAGKLSLRSSTARSRRAAACTLPAEPVSVFFLFLPSSTFDNIDGLTLPLKQRPLWGERRGREAGSSNIGLSSLAHLPHLHWVC